MQIELKVLNGLERLSEVLKSLLWEKAKAYGLSPIQIQILLFVSNHHSDICNVSYLAKEYSVSKATISDVVKVLITKRLLIKDFSPNDNRRYNLIITSEGTHLVEDLSKYAVSISDELGNFEESELQSIFQTISKLIYQLNQRKVIEVQRTCYNCRHYKGDRKEMHFCNLMDIPLLGHEIRLDCPEFTDSKSN